MDKPLPRVIKLRPNWHGNAHNKQRFPLCEARKHSHLGKRLTANCTKAGTYEVDGWNLCPVHAGQMLLEHFAVPQSPPATKETGDA